MSTVVGDIVAPTKDEAGEKANEVGPPTTPTELALMDDKTAGVLSARINILDSR